MYCSFIGVSSKMLWKEVHENRKPTEKTSYSLDEIRQENTHAITKAMYETIHPQIKTKIHLCIIGFFISKIPSGRMRRMGTNDY